MKQGFFVYTKKIIFIAAGCLALTACGTKEVTANNPTETESENLVSTIPAPIEETSVAMVGDDFVMLGDFVKELNQLQVGQLPDLGMEVADSDLYVEAVEGLSKDFIRGVDISSYLSERESGVVYRDFDGNELDDESFFNLLGECGVNWVRIRIWNNPYDTKGNSYGGGHNDIKTAITLGRLATQAGMQVLIDYHYSDFWADPSKQAAPKKWAHMTYDDKKAALVTFTEESMKLILDSGVNVGMVQLGNEIVSGMAGETDISRVCELLSLGSGVIRKISEERSLPILIAVHYTNPQNKGFTDYAKNLAEYQVDYDVFATSYYPFWHGTLENLTQKLSIITDTYGKQVLVAETSYAYTDEDGDGWSNSISYETENIELKYDFSLQGQVNEVRDVIQAVHNVGPSGMGVFYWEPAWIPVKHWKADDAQADSILNSNQEKWEKYGSGWASSFAKTFDPKDAGVYYGGSAWDNQAMFDFDGNPLDSLNVFRYIYTGTDAPLTVTGVQNTKAEIGIGSKVVLPDTVDSVLVNGKLQPVSVVWDKNQIQEAEAKGAGNYVIDGTATVQDTVYNVYCDLEIKKINYVRNPGFEEPDMSMWTISGSGVDREDDNNKHDGVYSLKFWQKDAFSYSVEQEITSIPEGNYQLGVFLQGGDAGANAIFKLYIIVDGVKYEADSKVTGWLKWDEPRIENIQISKDSQIVVGVDVVSGPGGWGAWDDFYLYEM